MSRTALNAIVDTVAYAGFVALATTGWMLRYQIPPGSGRLHGMGSGAGAAGREVTTVWGLSRHEWGSVHYWIALVLMAVLAGHLILHWKWIVCVLRGKPQSDFSGRRFALGVAGLVLVPLLAAAPLLTPAEKVPRSELLQGSDGNPRVDIADEATSMSRDAETIRGFMTLEEVARQTGVSVPMGGRGVTALRTRMQRSTSIPRVHLMARMSNSASHRQWWRRFAAYGLIPGITNRQPAGNPIMLAGLMTRRMQHRLRSLNAGGQLLRHRY